MSFQNKRCVCGGGGGGDKKIEASRKAQESVLQKTSSLLGFVAQDTGFPVLEGRASETRPPGNCGRLCRGTQVSQGRPLLWGTTIIERGRVNYSSINGRGMKIPISALWTRRDISTNQQLQYFNVLKCCKPYVPRETCIRRHAPSRTFRSPCYRIQVSLSGFVPQDTGFPVLEGRASETRPPGNCGRLCRGTQVSQGRPLFWCTTTVERGSVNYSSINGRGKNTD